MTETAIRAKAPQASSMWHARSSQPITPMMWRGWRLRAAKMRSCAMFRWAAKVEAMRYLAFSDVFMEADNGYVGRPGLPFDASRGS